MRTAQAQQVQPLIVQHQPYLCLSICYLRVVQAVVQMMAAVVEPVVFFMATSQL
jgi:hypothetical protein